MNTVEVCVWGTRNQIAVVVVVVVLVVRRPVDDDPVSQRGPSSAAAAYAEKWKLASASAKGNRESKAYIREQQEEREEMHDKTRRRSLCRRFWRMAATQSVSCLGGLSGAAELQRSVWGPGHVD